MSSRLFSDFEPSGKDAWEKQAAKELKGRLNALANWTVGSDLHFDPYLTAADLDAEKAAQMQAYQRKVPGWQNMPELTLTEPKKTNAAIRHALENGADAVILNLGQTDLMHCEFPKLLHGIKLSDTGVYFRTVESAINVFKELTRNAAYYLKGGIAFDPVANWLQTGEPIDEHIKSISWVLHEARNMRAFRPYMINGNIYHHNGANQAQELALILGATVECLDRLTNQGVSPLIAFNRICFSVSVGPEYLTEIAKLRALRYLLGKISEAYQLPFELSVPFIHVQTSTLNHADTAPDTNIIRSTSEAMSAVVGGCNALTVLPYDLNFNEQNEFSERIARNVSLLLKYESGLDTVADPAAGSYMIESMSLKLADKAWEQFLKIEEKGGFIRAVEDGFIVPGTSNAVNS